MRIRLTFRMALLALFVGSLLYYLFCNTRLTVVDSKNHPFKQQTEPPVDVVLPEFFPEPIRAHNVDVYTYLSTDGILRWTNEHRRQYQVPLLVMNEQLMKAASEKLHDMFQKGYFAHVSPAGVHPADGVRVTGYEFLMVGENLALGNFGDDESVVRAWMDSPGHRENILRSQYREIGIAVGQGIFNGSETWLAVQTFATHSSVCRAPDAKLAKQINKEQDELRIVFQEVKELTDEVEAISLDELVNMQDILLARDEIDQALFERVDELRGDIEIYNLQIEAYAECQDSFITKPKDR